MSPSPEIHSPADESLIVSLEKLKACIHCGMCLPACPTYSVTGSEAESPRGRLYLMNAMLNPAAATDVTEKPVTSQQVSKHLDQCLGCLACESVCPSGVEYGALLLSARQHINQTRGLSRHLKRFIFQAILPNQPLLQFTGRLLRFYQQSGIQTLVRKTGLLKLIPRAVWLESLIPQVPGYQEIGARMSFGDPDGTRVALMTGCIMDVLYNPVHWATIQVLAANNYRVSIPAGQTCCGALAHHAGETDITIQLAKKNIEAVLKENPQWIITNSAGCGSTLKEYGHLLSGDPAFKEKADLFAGKTVDIMELLAKKPLVPPPVPVQEKITYHAACHLYHSQGVKEAPYHVLSQVPGLELVPLIDESACCGSAGIYNIEHPTISRDILALKTARLKQTGAHRVVTGNPGCLLQLEKGLRDAGILMKVQHPVQILAQAYGK